MFSYGTVIIWDPVHYIKIYLAIDSFRTLIFCMNDFYYYVRRTLQQEVFSEKDKKLVKIGNKSTLPSGAKKL
jgi:hypothetical protein